MQRDVKIGIAIGVLLIALIAVFWWFRHNNRGNMPVSDTGTSTSEPAGGVPAPVVPVSPPAGVPGEVGPVVSATGSAPMTTGAMPMGTGPMAAATAVPPPPPMPVAANQTYTVQAGDNLAIIAQKFYKSQAKWNVIYEANKTVIGQSPKMLKPGMVLTIPGVPATSATGAAPTKPATGPAAAGGKYTVASGDSLTSIAQKQYGSATPADIARIYNANKATIGPDPDDLKVGMELVIPPAH